MLVSRCVEKKPFLIFDGECWRMKFIELQWKKAITLVAHYFLWILLLFCWTQTERTFRKLSSWWRIVRIVSFPIFSCSAKRRINCLGSSLIKFSSSSMLGVEAEDTGRPQPGASDKLVIEPSLNLFTHAKIVNSAVKFSKSLLRNWRIISVGDLPRRYSMGTWALKCSHANSIVCRKKAVTDLST